MSESQYKANDEVFNILTRKVGVVINAKEISSSVARGKRYVRVHILPHLPDEIWSEDETCLWNRQRRMMVEE
ncbi:MAG TPA: hypothetical protein VHE12_11750 [bacterium]|nr:hypothetical protein [bacterium]